MLKISPYNTFVIFISILVMTDHWICPAPKLLRSLFEIKRMSCSNGYPSWTENKETQQKEILQKENDSTSFEDDTIPHMPNIA